MKINKDKSYPETPSGMPGVQTLLPILLNEVTKKTISHKEVVKLTTFNPKKIFKIKKDIKTEIISNKIIENLSSKFDLTHFNLGPMAIANKNGIRNGTINLW